MNCALKGNSNTEILSASLQAVPSCPCVTPSGRTPFSMPLTLFTRVLVLNPSSPFLKLLLACDTVSQGAEGVIACPKHSLNDGTFEHLHGSVRVRVLGLGVGMMKAQCDSRVSLRGVVGHQCQAGELELILATHI